MEQELIGNIIDPMAEEGLLGSSAGEHGSCTASTSVSPGGEPMDDFEGSMDNMMGVLW